jgi:phosphate-selective porin OprO/OprP
MLASGLALAVILSVGTMAQAQMSLEERVHRLEEAAKTDEAKNMEVLWRNGLRLRTLNKDVEIRIGGRIQNDWNFIRPSDEIENAVYTDSAGNTSAFWPDSEPLDRVFFRRSRIFIRGTLHKYIRFKAEYDLVGGASWTDVYLRFVKLPGIGNLYLGKFKAPFGLEELTSSRFITFQERSLTDAFVLGREVGILVKNSAMDKHINWAVSMTRPDENGYGTSSGNDHNFTFRLAATPYRASKTQLVHVGLAYARLREASDYRFRARPEGRTESVRLVSTSKFPKVKGVDQYGLEAALVHGPISLQAEYMNVRPEVPAGGDPTFTAYYVMGSYFLTGESRPYSGGAFGRPKPKRKFDLKKGAMGAVELAARYSWIDLTEDDGGEERNVTLGLNWYPHNNARVTLNYVAAYLDRVWKGITLNDQLTSIVSMRFQVDF